MITRHLLNKLTTQPNISNYVCARWLLINGHTRSHFVFPKIHHQFPESDPPFCPRKPLSIFPHDTLSKQTNQTLQKKAKQKKLLSTGSVRIISHPATSLLLPPYKTTCFKKTYFSLSLCGETTLRRPIRRHSSSPLVLLVSYEKSVWKKNKP